MAKFMKLLNKLANRASEVTSEEAQAKRDKRIGKFNLKKIGLAVVVFMLASNVYSAVNRSVENEIEQASTSHALTSDTYSDQYFNDDTETISDDIANDVVTDGFRLSDIPDYDGAEFVEINCGQTYFTDQEKKYVSPFVTYAGEENGQAGQIFALVSNESVSSEYNNLYEIYPDGFCYLSGMQLVEECVYAAVTENPNIKVLYRCTPYYASSSSAECKGILVEAYSIEDEGAAVNFCIWCWNTDNVEE